MKKFVAIQMILAVLFFPTTSAFANENMQNADAQQEYQSTLEEILDNYHEESFRARTENNIDSRAYDNTTDSMLDSIRRDTVQTLQLAGYEAYDVNPNTYENLESVLNTDFSGANLNPDNSYIIVVEGEEGIAAPASAVGGTAGSTFTYVSGGVTYTMRYLTVTADDNPEYGQADDIDVLNSKSREVIENCLDALISCVVDTATGVPLGTIASICGLSISDFGTAQRSTLRLNCAANWTRKFTQVWDPNLEIWMFAACVERVKTLTHMSGSYYDAAENSYLPVPSDQTTDTIASEHFLDYAWRKEKAVLGYLLYDTQYDLTGDVKFKYGDRVVFTFRENFLI